MKTTIRVSAIFLLAIICVCYLGYTGHCTEKSQNVYYQSGKLKEEGNLKDGKREGIHKVYYESDKLKQEGNLKDGGREGIHKLYYENGTLAREGNFKHGRLLSETCYDGNGKKIKCPN